MMSKTQILVFGVMISLFLFLNGCHNNQYSKRLIGYWFVEDEVALAHDTKIYLILKSNGYWRRYVYRYKHETLLATIDSGRGSWVVKGDILTLKYTGDMQETYTIVYDKTISLQGSDGTIFLIKPVSPFEPETWGDPILIGEETGSEKKRGKETGSRKETGSDPVLTE